MYYFDKNKSYKILDNVIYENGEPIILDITKIMPNWNLTKIQSLNYVQSRLWDLPKRFKLIKQIKYIEQTTGQIELLWQ